MIKRIFSLGVAISVVFSLVAFLPAYAYVYDQNDIMDDPVFNNFGSMTASQIDTWLNGFANSCISPNSGFMAIDPTGYNPTQGFLYGGYVTAGKVIYDAAQAYQVNPQVLIATLEKEQSLITGQNNFSGFCESGNQNMYAAAMGYGCPDSGATYSYTGLNLYERNGVTVSSTGTTCVDSSAKAGFSQQVIRAAWLLKFGEMRSWGNVNWAIINGSWDNSDDPQTCYGGPTMQGTFAVCPSSPATYHDGYYTIDNTVIHINSGATAALYWYTPHFSGNENFFNIYTQWFGATKSVSLPGCTQATNTSLSCIWLLTSSTGAPFLTSSLTLRQELVDDDDYTYQGLSFIGNVVEEPGNIPIYLLGAPDGSSFLTASYSEYQSLISKGYTDHGIDFYADPSWATNTGTPVYRVYDPTTGGTIWTIDPSLEQSLVQSGWQSQGIAFNAIDVTRQETPPPQGDLNVYRFYIPQSNSHFWTTDLNERDSMINAGYDYEGVAWQSYDGTSGEPVYRLYAPSLQEHLYTTDLNEKNTLSSSGGWTYEGVSMYENPTPNSQPVYRLYAPTLGVHLWTADSNERSVLLSGGGWKDEGVAWYLP